MVLIEDIKKYLVKNTKKGYKVEDLVKYLINAGVPKKDVIEAEKELEEQGDVIPVKDYKMYIILSSIIIISIIGITWALMGTSKDCGYDKDCFTVLANLCENTKVRENQVGTTILYTTKDCILTKQVEKVANSEPEQVKRIFKDKTMRCPYTINNFDPVLIESLPSGSERCSGDLKSVLNELRITGFELGG